MSVSLPLVLVIAVVAIGLGVMLGRRRSGGGVRGFPDDEVRVIRPPVQPAAPVPSAFAADETPAALAQAINRATEAANMHLHVTPEMLANAKVTSDVTVSSSDGTLDPEQARAIMDAVSRAMVGQGTRSGGGALSPAVEAEVRALVAQGHLVNAVKRVREETRLGLKDAKDIIDAMQRTGR